MIRIPLCPDHAFICHDHALLIKIVGDGVGVTFWRTGEAGMRGAARRYGTGYGPAFTGPPRSGNGRAFDFVGRHGDDSFD